MQMFFEWANSASFLFIFGLFKQTVQILQQINVKKCHDHPVYSAGIWTHDLLNMSYLPQPLDQGSCRLNENVIRRSVEQSQCVGTF